MKNKKRYPVIAVILLVFILVSAYGYAIIFEKRIPSAVLTPQEYIPAVSSEKSTISLKTIPLTFELPLGYAIFQRESFEGGYTTTISFGKEVSSGHFEYAPLGMEFVATVSDLQLQREYSPREYIDVLFSEQEKDVVARPRYVTLFGNKAVSYNNASDESFTIVGYLRTDQVPGLAHDYLVRITSFTYGSGVGINQKLFDTVVNSLRVGK